jgi:hypothetical protein
VPIEALRSRTATTRRVEPLVQSDAVAPARASTRSARNSSWRSSRRLFRNRRSTAAVRVSWSACAQRKFVGTTRSCCFWRKK